MPARRGPAAVVEAQGREPANRLRDDGSAIAKSPFKCKGQVLRSAGRSGLGDG